MRKHRVLVVEDHQLSAFLLSKMLQKLGYEVAGVADSASLAIEMIHKTSPDVILLDIKLRSNNEGFEVAKYLENNMLPIPFIFTSLLMERNILKEATKLNPHSYLPKPCKPEELFTAIETAIFKKEDNNTENESPIENDVLNNGYIFLKTQFSEAIKILITDIFVFEADRNSTVVYTSDKKYVLHNRNLSYVEENVNNKKFLRVHRSFFVNTSHIKKIASEKITLQNGMEVSIGRTYKEQIEIWKKNLLNL